MVAQYIEFLKKLLLNMMNDMFQATSNKGLNPLVKSVESPSHSVPDGTGLLQQCNPTSSSFFP
jgi:hypothetical protein